MNRKWAKTKKPKIFTSAHPIDSIADIIMVVVDWLVVLPQGK